MADVDWGQLVGAGLSALNSYGTSEEASKISQAAYDEMLRNLRERFGDYDKLGDAGYEQLIPALLGPSAVSGIQDDPALRQAQQESLAELKSIIDSGGLTLSDLKGLNDVERVQNQNVTARRKGLANEYAARGQLGAGAQLAMDLDAQQNAAENAARAGESAAAQAQDRRTGAILKRGAMAGDMSAEEYKRKREAAEAEDFINRWNASTRNDAVKYGNTVKGQAFGDNLAKARGKTDLTRSMNDAVFGKGRDRAGAVETQGKYRNDMIKAGSNAASQFGQDDRSSTSDRTGDDGLDPDELGDDEEA